MTAAVWSLGHGEAPSRLIAVGILGLVYARVYRRTQSLLPCIALHVSQNVAAMAVLAAGKLPTPVIGYRFVVLGALVVFIPSLVMVFKLAPANPDERFILLGAARPAI